MIAIRAEIDAGRPRGSGRPSDNPLRERAAHRRRAWPATWDAPVLPARRRPSRAGVDPRTKYWPPVRRIDGAYGDRNLVCSCPPPEAFEELSIRRRPRANGLAGGRPRGAGSGARARAGSPSAGTRRAGAGLLLQTALGGMRCRSSGTWLTMPTARPPLAQPVEHAHHLLQAARRRGCRSPRRRTASRGRTRRPPRDTTSAEAERQGQRRHERLATGQGGGVAALPGPGVHDVQAQPADRRRAAPSASECTSSYRPAGHLAQPLVGRRGDLLQPGGQHVRRQPHPQGVVPARALGAAEQARAPRGSAPAAAPRRPRCSRSARRDASSAPAAVSHDGDPASRLGVVRLGQLLRGRPAPAGPAAVPARAATIASAASRAATAARSASRRRRSPPAGRRGPASGRTAASAPATVGEPGLPRDALRPPATRLRVQGGRRGRDPGAPAAAPRAPRRGPRAGGVGRATLGSVAARGVQPCRQGPLERPRAGQALAGGRALLGGRCVPARRRGRARAGSASIRSASARRLPRRTIGLLGGRRPRRRAAARPRRRPARRRPAGPRRA